MARRHRVARAAAVALGVAVLSIGAQAPAAAEWRWTETGFPAGAGGHIGAIGGAATADGTAVFWSGQADDPLATTWTRDATGWTARCGTPGTVVCPQGVRIAPGLGAGPGGVVLFGGQDGPFGSPASAYGDTWRFADGEWVEVCDTAACGPGARAGVAMAGNGSVVVLYGGLGGAPFHDDTWVYDGDGWTQVCGGVDPCGPGPLAGGSLAWDGSQFVLVGGVTFDGDVAGSDATWTFDVGAGAWSSVCGGADPCGPASRAFAPVATVGTGAGALLLGGLDLLADQGRNDAWHWDGSSWSPVDVPWEPGAFPLDGGDGCRVLPMHLAPEDGGVIAVVAVWGSERYPGDGAAVLLGADELAGPDPGDLCVAAPGGGTDGDGSGDGGSGGDGSGGGAPGDGGTPPPGTDGHPGGPAPRDGTGAPDPANARRATGEPPVGELARSGGFSESLLLLGSLALGTGNLLAVLTTRRRDDGDG